jgi:hypothetical protein
MRRPAPIVLTVLALAGCGGDDEKLPVSEPVTSPTPPPTDELKYDMLTAEIQLDGYRFSEGVYTADENLLGPAFPGTVTVKEADSRSFYIAAYDDQGTRFAMVKKDDVVQRTCDPPDPDACPDGKW